MMTAKQRYEKAWKDHDAKTPTIKVEGPAGMMFELHTMDAMAVAELLGTLGIKLQDIEGLPPETIGKAMLDRMDDIFARYVCPLSVAPLLVARHSEVDGPGDALAVADLRMADKVAIVNGLIQASSGAAGKAAADNFRDEPGRAAGGAGREGIRAEAIGHSGS